MPSWSDCRLRGLVNVAPRRPPAQTICSAGAAPRHYKRGRPRGGGSRTGEWSIWRAKVAGRPEGPVDGTRRAPGAQLPGAAPRRRARRGGRRSSWARAPRPPTTCSRASSTRASPCTRAGSTRRVTTSRRAPRTDRHALEDAVDDLFLRTHKRCYLGVVRGGVIEITVVRGRQGIARMPGLGTQITDNAHALAMGKVVLARLRPEALARYVGSGLTRYTPSTITSPVELAQRAAAGPRRRLRGRARGVRPRLLLRRGAGAGRARPARRGARAVGVDARVRRRARRAHGRGARHRRRGRPRAPRSCARHEPPPPFQHRAEKHAFLVARRTGHSLPSPLLSTPSRGDEGGPCTSTRRRSRQ